MTRHSLRVAFSGKPLRIPVGDGWLGRICDGRGEPLDGGPPVTGAVTAPVGGAPLNPSRRQPPAEPILTGVSVIDALTTLVRGQKIAIFSSPGLPHRTENPTPMHSYGRTVEERRKRPKG
jgi:V/A-type H+-transporting ATPase subunit B